MIGWIVVAMLAAATAAIGYKIAVDSFNDDSETAALSLAERFGFSGIPTEDQLVFRERHLYALINGGYPTVFSDVSDFKQTSSALRDFMFETEDDRLVRARRETGAAQTALVTFALAFVIFLWLWSILS